MNTPSPILLGWLLPLLYPCFATGDISWIEPKELTNYLIFSPNPTVSQFNYSYRDHLLKSMTKEQREQWRRMFVNDNPCFSIIFFIGESDFYLRWATTDNQDYIEYAEGFDYQDPKSRNLSKHPLTIQGFNDAILEFKTFCESLLAQTKWEIEILEEEDSISVIPVKINTGETTNAANER